MASLGMHKLHTGMYLKDWVTQLGAPEALNQRDGLKTFFYWPETGIAVFCHPRYFRQIDSVESNDELTVTAVYIPASARFSPPIMSDVPHIFFKKTMAPNINLNEVREEANVRFLRDGDEITAIKFVLPDSLLGDYD